MLIWYFCFTIFTIMNVSHTCLQFILNVFNSTVTRLSQHILCYLISKNLYSLLNVQPFIFQFICMQLCKYLNCFPKTHNKQINQYCLNFIIIFTKKNVLKNGSGRKSGRVDLQKTRVGSQVNSFLFQVKKIKFRSGIFWIGLNWIRKF